MVSRLPQLEPATGISDWHNEFCWGGHSPQQRITYKRDNCAIAVPPIGGMLSRFGTLAVEGWTILPRRSSWRGGRQCCRRPSTLCPARSSSCGCQEVQVLWRGAGLPVGWCICNVSLCNRPACTEPLPPNKQKQISSSLSSVLPVVRAVI